MTNLKVYKYRIDIRDEEVIMLPVGAKILKVDSQKEGTQESVFMWALVNTDAEQFERYVTRAVGTGQPADHVAEMTYMGSCKMKDDMFVWHVFYRKD
jgi:hypothetical protein